MKKIITLFASILFTTASFADEEIGSVTTAWKLLGANHRIAVEVFDDPKSIYIQNHSLY